MPNRNNLWRWCIGAATLVALTGAGLIFLFVPLCARQPATTPQFKAVAPPLFDKWPAGKKPDVVLLLTAEQHGFLKFCGCSNPQYGGLERRYNFLAQLKQKGWPVVALDLGDIVRRHEKHNTIQKQLLLKYATSMEALNLLGYSAIGVGEHEFNLPLLEGLSRYTLQKPDANPRVLAANLQDRMAKFPLDGQKSMIGDAVIIPSKDGSPTVGAICVVAPSARANIHDQSLKFAPNQEIIPQALKQFADNKVELKVLLYQGTPEEAAKAAETFSQFQVILSRTREEEPPAKPTVVGKSMIINVGWRGRYVGVIGAFRKPNAPQFELHYELVKLGPEFETEPAKEKSHPIIQLLENYAQEVKNDKLLNYYQKRPHPVQESFPKNQVAYVGSDSCKACHQAEYKKWEESKHSHGYHALETIAKKPSLRQYDGECIICHTVGYEYNTGFVDEKKTPHLKNIGCENCHGPGSMHAENPRDPAFLKAQSPWKLAPTDKYKTAKGEAQQQILLRIDNVCQKCHDQENDPNFKFENFWPKIAH